MQNARRQHKPFGCGIKNRDYKRLPPDVEPVYWWKLGEDEVKVRSSAYQIKKEKRNEVRKERKLRLLRAA